jgi:hypothetical protein
MGPVKGFVGDVWKIAAAFASGAFLLSLVTGLIAGNPFGVVIFRAFLLAVLFAGLGAGLRFAVKTYLPELLGSSRAATAGGNGAADAAADGAERASGSRGGAVDIVLQDDEGLRRQAYGGLGGGRQGGEVTDDEGEEPLSASLDGDFMSQGDTGGLPELAEELAEEVPPAGESTGVGSLAAAEPGEDTVGETEPTDELPRGMRGAAGGTDSLPDIDGLEAPEEKPARAPARPLRSADKEKPGDAVRNALSGQDPSTLARAIRTVLKNAEKG